MGEETAEELLREADAALYEAKAGGRDRAELFEQSCAPAIWAGFEPSGSGARLAEQEI